MKFIFRICLVFTLGALCASWSAINPSSKLVKAFEALEIYNYFAAKDLFYKTMKKDSVASGYGLSIIYGRNDNPFHNLDSAFKYIQISKKYSAHTTPEKWEDLAIVNVDTTQILNQEKYLDSCFFELAALAPSVDKWNEFIDVHVTEPSLSLAVEKRNALAFANSEEVNNSAAYLSYLNTYPDAKQVGQAKENYDLRLYEESVVAQDLESYRSFVSNHPETPYRKDAEMIIYELSTADGLATSYLNFISENPDNPCVNKAWRKIYTLEVNELTTESLASFTLKYPAYPFMEEVNKEFEAVTTRFYPVEISGKWGFIDDSGDLVIACTYDWVESFTENMAAVGSGEEVLFINKTGAVIIDKELQDAYSFHMGYVVAKRNDKSGVLNRIGEWVIQPEYDDLGEYSEGYFYAAKNGLYGYLDQKGETVIPFKYLDATDFKNGGAVVENAEGMGVINVSDAPITTFGFDWIEPFQENGKPSRFKVDNQFGLIRQNGNIQVSARYDRIGDWSDTLALAADNGKYGFINFSGDTLINFKYSYSSVASKESLFDGAFAKVYQDNAVGIIDTAGTKVFPAIFQDIGKFAGDLVAVKKRGKWGYADMEINLAIPYNFDQAGDFSDSVAVVVVQGKYGMINRFGEFEINPSYNSMDHVGQLLAVSDTAYGLINHLGIEVTPQIYADVKVIDERVIRLEHSKGGQDYYDYVNQRFIWKSNADGTLKE